MAVQPGPDDLHLLKDKVFQAAKDNQPEVIRDCLASLHPDVVNDVLHHCSEYPLSQPTPLIVSAWYGHRDVVELLVNEFNVNVNQKVSCCFNMHHALISAVRQGHLDIVKVLVRSGCDISTASRDGQTAIAVAYSENHVDVLKYLEENGAVLDEHLLKHGLKYACLKRPAAMVEYLLSKGADPNEQDDDGRTCLQVAAGRGAPDIIRQLLHHGATFAKDSYGRTPLMGAALSASSDAVKVFLESVDLDEFERIEGLELLGARLAAINVDEAFVYLRQAMEERYRNPNAVLLKPHSSLHALSNVQESQTLEELQARQSDSHLFRLECLAILSRILGPDDYVTVNEFRDYSDELQSAGRHGEATAVFLHGAKAAVKYSTNPMMTRVLLLELSMKFVRLLQTEMFTIFSDLEEIMESIQKLTEKGKFFCLKTLADDDIWLSYVLLALKVAQSQDEGRRLQRLTERFIRLSSGSPVLHTAVGLNWDIPICLRDLDDLPYDLLISFLLQCGADVHVKDGNKNTPLHTVARLSRRRIESNLISRITKTLLDAGAHVGVKNNKGQTPLDLAGLALAAELRKLYPVSLKSLAASVVVRHKISYVGEVPQDLEEFIEKH